MARTVKPEASPVIDGRKNEAVANAILDEYPKEVSGAVGIHALGKLADTMPHEEFVEFVQAALQHATTGQMPESEETTSQTGQPSGADGG